MILITYGLSRGLPLEDLCRAAGAEPSELSDPIRFVPFTVSLRLWRTLIARLPDENVGVGIGSFGKLEHLGAFWAFMKFLPNGLEVLESFARYSSLGDTCCIEHPITVVGIDDQVEMRWPTALKYGIPERTEALSVSVLRLLRELSDEPVTPLFVRAAHGPDPKRRIAEERLGCPVVWNSADDAVVFRRDALLKTFPGANPEAARALREMIETKIAADARLPLAERVRRTLELQLARGEAGQRSIARALGLSVRSLQRGLQDEGVRFSDLFGQVLKRAACARMLDRSCSIDQIALELGYSETSSFARSWRRLTGESPARYRARLLRAASQEPSERLEPGCDDLHLDAPLAEVPP